MREALVVLGVEAGNSFRLRSEEGTDRRAHRDTDCNARKEADVWRVSEVGRSDKSEGGSNADA